MFEGVKHRYAALKLMYKAAMTFSSAMFEGTGIGTASLRRSLPRTRYDYARDVAEGTGSSSIMAPIQWIQRAFPEAPLSIWKKKNEEKGDKLLDHRLIKLMHTPNPFYDEAQLWMAFIFSWATDGNVYFRKIRNGIREPVQLWYIPHWLIQPKWPIGPITKVFISHYEYNIGGQKERIPIEDIIHFRHGINPNNTRLGIAPLFSVMREVWSDDEASNWIASLLRNSGIPGVVMSPDVDGSVTVPADDVDAVKAYMHEMFTGDRRGEPLILSTKTKVSEFGFSPEKMDLSAVRNTAEERVCAALGIPAAVVGFGTGLETTKVGATMREFTRLAWTNGIIPLQRIAASILARNLLEDFDTDPEDVILGFDHSQIEALSEDKDKLFERADKGVKGGWLRVDQAKTMVGVKPEDGDDVYLRSIATIEVPQGQTQMDMAPPEPEAPTPQPTVPPMDDGGDEEEEEDEEEEKQHSNGHDKKASRRVQQLLRVVRLVDIMGKKLSAPFERSMTMGLKKMGNVVANAVDRRLQKSVKAPALLSDEELERIIEDIPWSRVRADMTKRYGTHYGSVAQETYSVVNTALGMTVNLADDVARRVVATGGRRLGLVDLEGSTKTKMFDILREAREAGEGAAAMVRRIRDEIPAGPWPDTSTRARVIARTETKFAQNFSMMEYSKSSGSNQVMMFDARLGPTDEECEARDQQIVSLEEAEAAMSEEHPNGTLSFVPYFAS